MFFRFAVWESGLQNLSPRPAGAGGFPELRILRIRGESESLTTQFVRLNPLCQLKRLLNCLTINDLAQTANYARLSLCAAFQYHPSILRFANNDLWFVINIPSIHLSVRFAAKPNRLSRTGQRSCSHIRAFYITKSSKDLYSICYSESAHNEPRDQS